MKTTWTITLSPLKILAGLFAVLSFTLDLSYQAVATQTQITSIEKNIKRNYDFLRENIADSNTTLRDELNVREELRKEIGNTRGELREELNIRGDLRDLRGDLIKHYENHAQHGGGE